MTPSTHPAPRTPPQRRQHAGKPAPVTRVLVVEDRATDFQHVSLLLQRARHARFEIERAETFDEGLMALLAGRHDVALVDQRLGVHSGLELLREAVRRECAVPIVMLTGHNEETVDLEAASLGAADFLPKSDLRAEVLERTIRYAIRHAAALTAVRVSQNQLENLMRGMPCAVCIHDPAGLVLFANDNFQQHFGSDWDAILQSGPADSALRPLEHRQRDWLVSTFLVSRQANGELRGFAAVDVTDRKRLERELLGAIDAEQRRIGAELHDHLGQQLTGVACLGAALRHRLQTGYPDAAGDAEAVERIAKEALANVRSVARGLVPVQFEPGGLRLALDDLVAQVNRLSGVRCRLEVQGDAPPCDHDVALHVFRIAQESIANALRHGRAQEITVRLDRQSMHHRISIADNGEGFDPALPQTSNGVGLRLMKYRASIIGGDLAVKSAPGRGTRVECWFKNGSTSVSTTLS